MEMRPQLETVKCLKQGLKRNSAINITECLNKQKKAIPTKDNQKLLQRPILLATSWMKVKSSY